jgi:hypothetical protein
MDIDLEVPVQMSEIQWLTSIVGKLLPAPKSTTGKFSYEHDGNFYVYIGNTSTVDCICREQAETIVFLLSKCSVMKLCGGQETGAHLEVVRPLRRCQGSNHLWHGCVLKESSQGTAESSMSA